MSEEWPSKKVFIPKGFVPPSGINPDLDYVNNLESENRRLQANQKALREALMPFARLDVNDLDCKPDTHPVYGRNSSIINVGDIRKAKSALAGEGKDKYGF